MISNHPLWFLWFKKTKSSKTFYIYWHFCFKKLNKNTDKQNSCRLISVNWLYSIYHFSAKHSIPAFGMWQLWINFNWYQESMISTLRKIKGNVSACRRFDTKVSGFLYCSIYSQSWCNWEVKKKIIYNIEISKSWCLVLHYIVNLSAPDAELTQQWAKDTFKHRA